MLEESHGSILNKEAGHSTSTQDSRRSILAKEAGHYKVCENIRGIECVILP